MRAGLKKMRFRAGNAVKGKKTAIPGWKCGKKETRGQQGQQNGTYSSEGKKYL
jgi:hypothetical protein